MQPIFVDVSIAAKFGQRVLVVIEQRCTGESNELGMRQAGAHEGGKEVILTAVRFIDHHVEIGLGAQYPEVDLLPADFLPFCGQHHAIGIRQAQVKIALHHHEEVLPLANAPMPGRLQGIAFLIRGGIGGVAKLFIFLELLHGAGKYAAVVVTEQLDKPIDRHGLNRFDAHGMEGVEDLLVEVLAVGEHQHGRVVQSRAVGTQHPRQQRHGQRLAAALRVPYHTTHGLGGSQASDGFAHCPPLLITGQFLHRLAVAGFKQHEVGNQFEKTRRLEQRPQQLVLLARGGTQHAGHEGQFITLQVVAGKESGLCANGAIPAFTPVEADTDLVEDELCRKAGLIFIQLRQRLIKPMVAGLALNDSQR